MDTELPPPPKPKRGSWFYRAVWKLFEDTPQPIIWVGYIIWGVINIAVFIFIALALWEWLGSGGGFGGGGDTTCVKTLDGWEC